VGRNDDLQGELLDRLQNEIGEPNLKVLVDVCVGLVDKQHARWLSLELPDAGDR